MHKNLDIIKAFGLVEKVINNLKDKECQKGDLIEISIENEPTLIVLNDGSAIWKK